MSQQNEPQKIGEGAQQQFRRALANWFAGNLIDSVLTTPNGVKVKQGEKVLVRRQDGREFRGQLSGMIDFGLGHAEACLTVIYEGAPFGQETASLPISWLFPAPAPVMLPTWFMRTAVGGQLGGRYTFCSEACRAEFIQMWCVGKRDDDYGLGMEEKTLSANTTLCPQCDKQLNPDGSGAGEPPRVKASHFVIRHSAGRGDEMRWELRSVYGVHSLHDKGFTLTSQFICGCDDDPMSRRWLLLVGEQHARMHHVALHCQDGFQPTPATKRRKKEVPASIETLKSTSEILPELSLQEQLSMPKEGNRLDGYGISIIEEAMRHAAAVAKHYSGVTPEVVASFAKKLADGEIEPLPPADAQKVAAAKTDDGHAVTKDFKPIVVEVDLSPLYVDSNSVVPGRRPPEVPLFSKDAEAAKDGWCISHVDCANSPFRLERIDQPADGVPKFKSDLDAWHHVASRCSLGDPVANAAVEFLAKHSKPEYGKFIRETLVTGQKTCYSFQLPENTVAVICDSPDGDHRRWRPVTMEGLLEFVDAQREKAGDVPALITCKKDVMNSPDVDGEVRVFCSVDCRKAWMGTRFNPPEMQPVWYSGALPEEGLKCERCANLVAAKKQA